MTVDQGVADYFLQVSTITVEKKMRYPAAGNRRQPAKMGCDQGHSNDILSSGTAGSTIGQLGLDYVRHISLSLQNRGVCGW
jgi:hypothetical protein